MLYPFCCSWQIVDDDLVDGKIDISLSFHRIGARYVVVKFQISYLNVLRTMDTHNLRAEDKT
jgi:hypothetical protein